MHYKGVYDNNMQHANVCVCWMSGGGWVVKGGKKPPEPWVGVSYYTN